MLQHKKGLQYLCGLKLGVVAEVVRGVVKGLEKEGLNKEGLNKEGRKRKGLDHTTTIDDNDDDDDDDDDDDHRLGLKGWLASVLFKRSASMSGGSRTYHRSNSSRETERGNHVKSLSRGMSVQNLLAKRTPSSLPGPSHMRSRSGGGNRETRPVSNRPRAATAAAAPRRQRPQRPQRPVAKKVEDEEEEAVAVVVTNVVDEDWLLGGEGTGVGTETRDGGWLSEREVVL